MDAHDEIAFIRRRVEYLGGYLNKIGVSATHADEILAIIQSIVDAGVSTKRLEIFDQSVKFAEKDAEEAEFSKRIDAWIAEAERLHCENKAALNKEYDPPIQFTIGLSGIFKWVDTIEATSKTEAEETVWEECIAYFDKLILDDRVTEFSVEQADYRRRSDEDGDDSKIPPPPYPKRNQP